MLLKRSLAGLSATLVLLFLHSCASVPTHITMDGKKHKVTNKGFGFAVTANSKSMSNVKSGPVEFLQKGSIGGIVSMKPACRLSNASELKSGKAVSFKVIKYEANSAGSFHETEMVAKSTSGKTILSCWHDKNRNPHLTVSDLSHAFGKIAKIK